MFPLFTKKVEQFMFVYSLFISMTFPLQGMSQQNSCELNIISMGPIIPSDTTIIEIRSTLSNVWMRSNLRKFDSSWVKTYGILKYKLQSKEQWLTFYADNHIPQMVHLPYDFPVKLIYTIRTDSSCITTKSEKLDGTITNKKEEPDTSNPGTETLSPLKPPPSMQLYISGELFNDFSSLSSSAIFDFKIIQGFSLLGGYNYSFLKNPATDQFQTLSGIASYTAPDKRIHSAEFGFRYYQADRAVSLSTIVLVGLTENYTKYSAMCDIHAFKLASSKMSLTVGYWHHKLFYQAPVFNPYGDASEQKKKHTDQSLSVGIGLSFPLF